MAILRSSSGASYDTKTKKKTGGKYTSEEVARINAAREANISAGNSAYSGEGSTSSVRRAPSGGLSGGTSEYQAGTSGTPFGASGRGEFLNNPEYAAEQEALIKSGAPMSAGSDYKSYFEPSLTSKESADIVKKYGLQGLKLDNAFSGLTRTQAMAKALEEGQKRRGTALTSYAFNPESMSNFKKGLDSMRIGLDDTKNDAWSISEDKKDKTKSIVESYTSDLAKNFSSMDEFNNAMSTPEGQKLMEQYRQMGGDPNSIAARVSAPVTVAETQKNSMSTADYIGELTSPSQKKAYEQLIPEQQMAQDEIAFEQSIPEQVRQYYFGSEDEVGFVQRQKQQATEEMKILERRAKLDEKNAKAQADYESKKLKASMDIADASIEENRLAAKNYMTGMLAKLGALKTTGAAPQALGNLEQKYQQQRQQLRSNFDMANLALEIDLSKTVDEIGLQRDEEILKVKQDLSKSDEDIWKEIFKLQNDADRKSFDIVGKYTRDFRTQTEKYEKEAKAEAEKYAKEFQKTVSYYDLDGAMEGGYVTKRDAKGKKIGGGILSPTGDVREIADILESSKGSDGYVNSETYQKMLNEFLKAGGTRTDFIKKFPPNQYTNPKDASLPSFLRFGSSSRAEANTDDEFGKLTPADERDGMNWLINNGASEEDKKKFKEDREFQAWVLSQQ